MATTKKTCKDCMGEDDPPAKPRPAPHPGPRCASHWRAEKKRRKASGHARMVERVYGITGDEYDALKAIQGGVCAICQRATGATRRLSVDHDHETGKVRGLLCRPCNDMLGHARDQISFFQRAIAYLHKPPKLSLEQTRLIDLVQESERWNPNES